ncbi:MAG: T9SS type A sorting domain-containing protein, partial [Gracilimonas sp.]
TLDYRDEAGFTDMLVQSTGETSLYSNEFTMIIPNNPVESVELAESDLNDVYTLSSAITGDTIRVAIAGNRAMNDAGLMAKIRFSYNEDATVNNASELLSFDKFMINESDLTEFVNATYTSTEAQNGGIPEEFALKQNYPNPFNPSTKIAYDLPQAGEVTIQVYNILGQLVNTVVSERQKAGRYNIRWDASQFGSGTYLLRIDFKGNDNQSYSQVRKMLLIK